MVCSSGLKFRLCNICFKNSELCAFVGFPLECRSIGSMATGARCCRASSAQKRVEV